jgi:hypothetical protein
MRKLKMLCLAMLLPALSGCDGVYTAAVSSKPYRLLDEGEVPAAVALPITTDGWIRQAGMWVLPLQHGWLVRVSGGGGISMVFVPHPQ